MSAPPARTGLADTYPNPSNAVFRTAIGALYDYLVGLLGTTGGAAEARTALAIGPVISFRNKVINGSFSVNQRSYVSGTPTAVANAYTLDRWRVVTSGQSLTFSASGAGNAVVAPAGGIEQVIEGNNIEGGVYTLSWVGAGTATVNGVAIANGGQTSSLAAATNVTLKFIGAVSRVQFELGTVATPFEQRHPGLELLLARRYYYRNSNAGQGLVASGMAFATTGAAFMIQFPVTMRSAPTLSSTNLFPTNGAGTLISPTGSSLLGISSDSALVQINVASGLTVGNASLLYAGNGSGGLIDFSAEL
jgi:hypothetical protein